VVVVIPEGSVQLLIALLDTVDVGIAVPVVKDRIGLIDDPVGSDDCGTTKIYGINYFFGVVGPENDGNYDKKENDAHFVKLLTCKTLFQLMFSNENEILIHR
jgi:hypothetical protein